MVRITTSIKIDEDLWAEFKSNCALQKRDMSDVLEELVKVYLKEK